MLPIDIPPWDFNTQRPPPPIIQAWGGTPIDPTPTLDKYHVNPLVGKWLLGNSSYYAMPTHPPGQGKAWYGDAPPAALHYPDYPPLDLLWDNTPKTLLHEGTHDYLDYYWKIWGGGQEGKKPSVNPTWIRGPVKQMAIDPTVPESQAKAWARWFATQPADFPDYEIYATLAPYYADLPLYVQAQYRGLLTPESVEGKRRSGR